MMEYVRMVVATFVMLGGVWLASDILYREKSKKDIKSILAVLLASMIISIFNINKSANFMGYTKIFLIFLMMIFFFKIKYKTKISDAIIGSIIIYANALATELITTIGILLISKIFAIDFMKIARFSILSAIITATISILILKTFDRKYLKLFKKIQKHDTKLVTVLIIVFMIITIISGIIHLKNLNLGIEMLLVIILMIGFVIVGAYIFLESIEKDNRLKEYEQLSEYAKANESLLEDYRVRCHESSNHLIIIDNMIPKNNKKAHEYIRSLLSEHKVNKYYFINELKNIPITEFKGFINFKLMTMINENMDLQINVSPEMKNSKLKDLSQKDKIDLYNITGVLLDNACDASKESTERQVVFTMYKEREDVVMMIANTYKGEIDINRVSEYGYSTKGKNHGTGLYIVDKVINKNSKFTKETSIIENYFIQIIRIK